MYLGLGEKEKTEQFTMVFTGKNHAMLEKQFPRFLPPKYFPDWTLNGKTIFYVM